MLLMLRRAKFVMQSLLHKVCYAKPHTWSMLSSLPVKLMVPIAYT